MMARRPLCKRDLDVLEIALIFGGFQQVFTQVELLAFLHAGGEREIQQSDLAKILARLVDCGQLRRLRPYTYARSVAAETAAPDGGARMGGSP